ncbi:Sugar phosphate isomerase/epimerase [Geodermatophilus siccatus]|uniref:Sugar phosphate isomerase/epimerase n=1 Tax=Geodermatophilus siccatus TaxID=1137991 RepID=A0A1G9XE58_9ACTN|nr:sugar phosphate isomerase/epimerase family protein [Geodermatophilus siccatus]SDM94746.1 Sugar phosphate isomerase/epimerase [Geodermatophilus siccatus]
MRLAVQEQLLPGDTMQVKWEAALAWGFDAIELRGAGGHALRARLPELLEAQRDGVVMPTVCVDMDHFIGDFDPARRADAVANMATQLAVIGALGGVGAMTPASWGMFSRRLPPFTPPRSAEGDREVLLEALTRLGEVAAREGVLLLLEPLNRYEDHMVNTLAQAAELARATGLGSVQVGADTYHMNIEEADPLAALRANADRLGHVQLSDSNRLEPGAGHLDWAALLRCLEAIGYGGWLAFECRLSGDPARVLPRATAMLRSALRAAA